MGHNRLTKVTIVRHNRLTKVTIVNFPPTLMPLVNFSKNYTTLYFVIYFNDLFYHYSIVMGYLK